MILDDPGRRYAADAASLCPGLSSDGPLGQKHFPIFSLFRATYDNSRTRHHHGATFREMENSESMGLTEIGLLVTLTPQFRVEAHAGHHKFETHTGQSDSSG